MIGYLAGPPPRRVAQAQQRKDCVTRRRAALLDKSVAKIATEVENFAASPKDSIAPLRFPLRSKMGSARRETPAAQVVVAEEENPGGSQVEDPEGRQVQGRDKWNKQGKVALEGMQGWLYFVNRNRVM